MPAAPVRKRRPAKARQATAWDQIRFLLLLALAAFVLRGFVFAPFSIPTGSMLPSLLVGDYLFVSKWKYGF